MAAAAVAAYSPAAPMATARGLVQPPLKRAGSDATQPSCSACGMRLIGTEALHFCVLVDIHRWIVSGVRFVPPAFPPDFRGDTLIMVVRPQGLRTACCSVGMLQQRCPAACVQTASLCPMVVGRRAEPLETRRAATGTWQAAAALSAPGSIGALLQLRHRCARIRTCLASASFGSVCRLIRFPLIRLD